MLINASTPARRSNVIFNVLGDSSANTKSIGIFKYEAFGVNFAQKYKYPEIISKKKATF